jgi:hypothetical protein
MASGSPEHHMDRLGHRLGDRTRNPILAPEERIGSSNLTRRRIAVRRSRRARTEKQGVCSSTHPAVLCLALPYVGLHLSWAKS